jgi:glycosyltransferase involved in cell wall biosynthesis
MNFLRRFARRFFPKSCRAFLGQIFDAVLIWHWKFRWWQKRGFRPIQSPKKKGVLLVGYLQGGFGIGSSLRLSALALKEAGVPFKVFDFNPRSHAIHNDDRLNSWLTQLPEYSINIFYIGVLQLPILKKTLGKQFFQNRHNILYGAWELERLPEKWMRYLEDIDEIWAMSSFVGQMFRRSTSLPVYDLQLPIVPDQLGSWSRTQFQIPENDFVFLFMFDFDSHLVRKNPEAVIEAFKLAFPQSSHIPVRLVIKSIHGERHEKESNRLKNKMKEDPRILQIHQELSHSENAALMQCCDCYISLHRSEGFGLTLAEMMLMGKPVITTGYSGNMDFTTPKTALLVDYQLVPVELSFPYEYSEGELWAEPNVQQASDYMRELVEDSTFARPLAQKGEELIRTSFSTTAMGERYKKRLSTLLM